MAVSGDEDVLGVELVCNGGEYGVGGFCDGRGGDANVGDGISPWLPAPFPALRLLLLLPRLLAVMVSGGGTGDG